MAQKTGKVVEIRSPDVIRDGKIDGSKALEMFELGFDTLSSTGVGYDFIERQFSRNDTIGVKINTLSGRMMSTSPELVGALADYFGGGGYKKNKLIVWDRREDELKRAGYPIRTGGSDYRCFATNTAGVGFAQMLYNHKSIGSLISKIQAEICSAAIIFPVLKDHSIAGLSGCLKNYYGVIHNPNKYHENMCNPYLADLYALEVIKGKQKLAVFDAIRVQYNGGPGYVGRWLCDYGAILMSTDAVALDTIGLKIIDDLRTKNGLKVLKESGREPIGITAAGEDGLGCADPEMIEWIVKEV